MRRSVLALVLPALALATVAPTVASTVVPAAGSPVGYEAGEATTTWTRTVTPPRPGAGDTVTAVAQAGWSAELVLAAGTTTGDGTGVDSFVQVRRRGGALVRTQRIATAGDDRVTAVSPDSVDGYVVAGTTTGVLVPGSAGGGSRAGFVRSYDHDGSVERTIQFGEPGLDYAVHDVFESYGYSRTVVTGDVGPAAGGPRDAFVRVYGGSTFLGELRPAATVGDDRGVGGLEAAAPLDETLLVAGTTTGDLDDPGAAARGDRDRWFASYEEVEEAPGFVQVWRSQLRAPTDDALVDVDHHHPAFGRRGVYYVGETDGDPVVGAVRVTNGAPRWQHPVPARDVTALTAGFAGVVVAGNVTGRLPGAPSVHSRPEGYLMGWTAGGRRGWTSRVPAAAGGTLRVEALATSDSLLTPYVVGGRVTGLDGAAAFTASLDVRRPRLQPGGSTLEVPRGTRRGRTVELLNSGTVRDSFVLALRGCRAPGLSVRVLADGRDVTRAMRDGTLRTGTLVSLDDTEVRLRLGAAPGAALRQTTCTLAATSRSERAASDVRSVTVAVVRR